MRTTPLGVTIYIVRASKFICIQDYKAFKINTLRNLSNYNKPGENYFCLVHSCCRGVGVHFLAHKTTLLTLTLRHSNAIKSNMNADSTKGHITLVTNPTKPVQPYKTTSSEDKPPNGDKTQHKKSNMKRRHFTPTPVCNPVFH
jgi:hypothetical protein